MTAPVDLIKAIRTGMLSEVIAALDAGAPVELHDGQGDPGLPVAMACFLGHPEIVRELALRGARVNLPDNAVPTSPLSMAIRGKRSEVVKVLIELGVSLPAGTQTGLTDQEILLAQWKAQHLNPLGLKDAASGLAEPVIEEIHVVGCYGTDTNVLDAEMRRAVQEMCKK